MLYTPRCQCDVGGGFKDLFTLSILNLSFGKWCMFANILQKAWNHHFCYTWFGEHFFVSPRYVRPNARRRLLMELLLARRIFDGMRVGWWLLSNCGTLNNHFLMDVWWNNHFLCKGLKSSNWNNQGFQVWLRLPFGSTLHPVTVSNEGLGWGVPIFKKCSNPGCESCWVGEPKLDLDSRSSWTSQPCLETISKTQI